MSGLLRNVVDVVETIVVVILAVTDVVVAVGQIVERRRRRWRL